MKTLVSRPTFSKAARSLSWPVAAGLAFLCLGALPAGAQNQLWIEQFGTSGSGDEAYAAAPDGSGGVYVGGLTYGSLGGPIVGAYDAYIARFDSAGNQLWARQLGTSTKDWARAAAPDGTGGVYVGGSTDGSLGGPNFGQRDAWFARYDFAGNQLWIRQLGTSSHEDVRAAAPDGSGGVYVGGVGAGWFARYDGAGNELWIRQLGTGTDTLGAAPDDSGGVYVCGGTGADLGGPNAGAVDAWVSRYDSAGNQLWIRQLGTSDDDPSYAAASDGSGGVYVGGITEGSLGGPSAGGPDAWLAHYDSTGNQSWVRQLGTSGADRAYAAAPDGSGGVYVGGDTRGSLGGPYGGGIRDAWFARYDSAGNQVWIHQLATSGTDRALAAASDGSRGVYVGGTTSGNLGMPVGGYDAWLARYAPEPAPYCTAKPNSCGTLPSISSTGTPSSTSGSGFTVSAANTKALKAGLLIYTDSGPGNAPFSGGILCLNTSPLKRSIAVIDTTGTPGQCDGTLSIDMNAFAVGALGGNPLPSLLVPGSQVNCQFWGRDTQGNSLLSDAVEYFVGS